MKYCYPAFISTLLLFSQLSSSSTTRWWRGSVTKNDFYDMMELAKRLYDEDHNRIYGTPLFFDHVWGQDNDTNLHSEHYPKVIEGDRPSMLWYGTFARSMHTVDSLWVVMCHELGHLLSTKRPAVTFRVSEGEASYWATGCLKKVFSREKYTLKAIKNYKIFDIDWSTPNFVEVDESKNKKWIIGHCGLIYRGESEVALCSRIALAALQAYRINQGKARVHASERVQFGRSINARFSVSDHTQQFHPYSRQCELNTYLAGAFCRDIQNECKGINHPGARPVCWDRGDYPPASKFAKEQIKFLSSNQAAEELGHFDEFLLAMKPDDFRARLQTDSNVDVSDYLEQLRSEMLDWTLREKELVRRFVTDFQLRLAQLGLEKLLPRQLTFIKAGQNDARNKHEFGAFYTRKNILVVPQGQFPWTGFFSTMVHEIFHIISRENRDLFEKHLYMLTPFSKVTLKTPQLQKNAHLITNPDGISSYLINFNQNYYSNLNISTSMVHDGKINYSNPASNFYELENVSYKGSSFSADFKINGEKGPIKLNDTKEVRKFLRANSNYIIHPDEVLAEHFKYLIHYDKVYTGMKAEREYFSKARSKHLPFPKEIDRILDRLLKIVSSLNR